MALFAGGVIALSALAVGGLLVFGEGDGFDPAAYESIAVGDSEKSVIAKLGEPDDRVTLAEALHIDDPSGGEGGTENLYWVHDEMSYLIGVQDGRVTLGPDEPTPCDQTQC